MEAVRIREGVETEEEVLTGAAIVGRQAGRVRVQLKTDVETVEETEEKPKHYRFTLIEFCTRETAKLEARINGSLAKWIEEARRIAAEKAGEKTAEEKYDDLKETTDELVETMADILGGKADKLASDCKGESQRYVFGTAGSMLYRRQRRYADLYSEKRPDRGSGGYGNRGAVRA